MYIPKSIKVGGFIITIKHGAKITSALRNRNKAGEYSPLLKRIDIDDTMPKQSISCSLIHEITHAIDDIYNSYKLEEETIERLSQGWFQVFRQLDIEFSFRDS